MLLLRSWAPSLYDELYEIYTTWMVFQTQLNKNDLFKGLL